jgi:type I restriction enzyme M protein
MLDSETKRRIDTARDILVGKVPDPKSQVEQITIALIYKFMDDMDAQAEEVGGKRKFFTGEFVPYGWAKLMAPSVSGEERIALYVDGMVKMTQNPGVPQLFRNIFKNAFLPYRDPETLHLFLKTINEFEYDHSERLGDAFEYLLSVLGSQGQAGQFRTPRHIIDFIVGIVDPKKNETVLDPACGTAGFLISAYKHILRANSSSSSPSGRGQGEGALNGEAALHTSRIPAAKGDLLSPDERKKLADNFRGYDISPDMVRLSLVNMYLHGFTDPHVYEYDTLTSQDRWNEMADVILANPPFMSPKGGIKPHNRFSVPSKRSEVLFVDYMAEHLTPGGRAGIIVPEGIIFQSQTAYKTLRKMLVEQYLVAVVSLPAGVFQPYSGVKTSILILDKSLARRSDTVGFFKVENDGFNLGAQRRPIDKNDLPQALAEINEYLRRLRAKESVATEDFTPTRGMIVAKEKIAAKRDFILSGERYRGADGQRHTFPMVPLSEICSVGGTITTDIDLALPYFGADSIDSNTGRLLRTSTAASQGVDGPVYSFEGERLLYSKIRPYLNKLTVVRLRGYCSSDMYPLIVENSKADIRYVAAYMLSKRFNDSIRGYYERASIPKINRSQLFATEIPLPPLEVQKEIVAEIEAFQKVIDGARAVLDHYRPHIPINLEWPMVTIGDVSEQIQYGLSEAMDAEGKGFKTFRMNELVAGVCIDRGNMKNADISREEFEKYQLKRGDLLFNRTNSFEHVGRTGIFDLEGEYCFASYLIRLTMNQEKAVAHYVNAYMNSDRFQEGIKQFATRAIGQSNINAKSLAAYPIPLPPLAVQREIVAEIEAEQRLVEGNRQLVERMEQKIAATLERIWGEPDETHPPAAEPTAELVSA